MHPLGERCHCGLVREVAPSATRPARLPPIASVFADRGRRRRRGAPALEQRACRRARPPGSCPRRGGWCARSWLPSWLHPRTGVPYVGGGGYRRTWPRTSDRRRPRARTSARPAGRHAHLPPGARQHRRREHHDELPLVRTHLLGIPRDEVGARDRCHRRRVHAADRGVRHAVRHTRRPSPQAPRHGDLGVRDARRVPDRGRALPGASPSPRSSTSASRGSGCSRASSCSAPSSRTSAASPSRRR